MFNNIKTLLTLCLIVGMSFVFCMFYNSQLNGDIVAYEKSKTSILILDNTYNKSFNSIISDLQNYTTNPTETTAYTLSSHINNFITLNNMNLKSIDDYEDGKPITCINMDYSGDTFTFYMSKQQVETLHRYLENYNDMAAYVSNTFDTKSTSLHKDEAFSQMQLKRNVLSSQYTLDYVNHLDDIVKNLSESYIRTQRFILILGVVLSLFVLRTTFLYIKETQSHRYYDQLYSRAMKDANVGLAICDKDYNYEYVNTQYLKLLKLGEDSLLGKNARVATPKNIQEALMANNDTPHREATLVSFVHSGETYYINHSRFVIFDEKNNLKIVSVIQDYTDSVKKDMKLQKQLKKSEDAAAAKSAFVANVSHEIKTPLNVISGMLHMLKGTSLTEEQVMLTEKMSDSTDLLSCLIDDILDLSQMQRDDITLVPMSFNLLDFLHGLKKSFATNVEDADLDFITEFNVNPKLEVSLDKTRLNQLLLNLLSNAVKFTSNGYIKLSAKEQEHTKNSVLIQFTVEDTGAGIAESDISKIFQDFEQVEGYLTKQHSGAGLGLPICKQISNLMDGNLWVESKKDEGSKFHFMVWCPLSTENKHKVLVVEDIELNYEVTKSMLEEANILCDHAWDGQEAVDTCLSIDPHYYSAILMDIHMPNLDGYTAAEIIRTEIGLDTPIIALTATNYDESTKKEYEGIINDFLSKPFKFEDLLGLLSPYLFSTDDSRVFTQDFITQGAKTLGGSEKLFKKHLGKFISSYTNSTNEILNLFIEHKYEESHRLAHSIKGLSGTLSFFELQERARDLEAYLKPFATEDSTRPSCEIEMSQVISELKPLLNSYDIELQKVCSKKVPE